MPRLMELDRAANGRIYVIRFDTGEFKIGKSLHLKQRINQLRSEMRNRTYRPARVVDGWYSHEHAGFHRSEMLLHAFCLERFGAPVYGAEMFEGDAEIAISYAEEVTGTLIAAVGAA